MTRPLDAQDLQNFFGNFKDIEGRLMGVVIFLIMCKKCIIKQLTSVQPPSCNIVTYSVLIEQLRKSVPQERLFTCYTWLISSSRSRPIVALLVILYIVGITLFAVYRSLFAVVNLLRAAVIFSNKHPTITPVNCIYRDQVGKTGTKIRDQITIV